MAASKKITPRDRMVSTLLGGAVLFMLALTFASAPLYDLFCRTTGYGGTTQVATEQASRLGKRRIKIRFDANVSGIPWFFKPEQTEVTVRTGETKEVRYSIASAGDKPTTGIASYNVVPELAGAYFNKLQCFCFTNQTLQGHEQRDETVVFFIDPAIEKDPNLAAVDTITLSYTFFPAKEVSSPLASVAPLGQSTQQ